MTFLLKLFSGLKGLWGYAATALGAIAAVVIYLAGRKSARDAIKVKQTETAAKVRTQAHQAHIKGVQRDKQIRKKPVDTKRRDYFSK